MEKLKDLYNNIDVDYNKVQLYLKNCTEIDDWYYKELIEIFKSNAYLPTFIEEEECHGIHKFEYYTNEAQNEIDLFINKLNKIINDNNTYSYNSSNLIN